MRTQHRNYTGTNNRPRKRWIEQDEYVTLAAMLRRETKQESSTTFSQPKPNQNLLRTALNLATITTPFDLKLNTSKHTKPRSNTSLVPFESNRTEPGKSGSRMMLSRVL